MWYNTQGYDEPNKQHFVWGNSSELNLENSKGPVSGGLHITNQFALNDDNCFCLRMHMWIQFMECRLTQICIFSFGLRGRGRNKKGKTYVDIICCTAWLTLI